MLSELQPHGDHGENEHQPRRRQAHSQGHDESAERHSHAPENIPLSVSATTVAPTSSRGTPVDDGHTEAQAGLRVPAIVQQDQQLTGSTQRGPSRTRVQWDEAHQVSKNFLAIDPAHQRRQIYFLTRHG